MAELTRGAIADRPWGRTLGALGTRGLSGELTVTADGKPYRVAFAHGAVVGATSPLASDAAVRVALTGGLISSTQVNDITRRIATSPHRDEIDVVAEAAKLGPDQARQLRRRLVAQRAARTFSVERGEFVVDDHVTVPVLPGNELDIRAIIYMGAKSNLSEERLAIELNQFGAWFRLTPDGIADLAQFGFTEIEKPALHKLVEGINLEDLERQSPELGERGVRAIVYALAAVGACEAEVAPRAIPGRVTRDSIPPLQPPRAGNPTQAPLRRGVTAAPTTVAAKGSGSTRAETPDGMSLRTPRSSVPPPNQPRTQTPSSPPNQPRTQTPSSPPPNQPRTQTPSSPPPNQPRTQTPSSPPPERASSPSSTRPPTPTNMPVTGRAHTPTTTPTSPRTPTPNHITGEHPALARTATPTTPPASRTMTPVAQARTSTGPAQARTSTGPVISRTISGNRAKVPSSPPPGTEDVVRMRQPSGQHPVVQPLATPRPQRSGSSPPPMRQRRNTAATVETEALIRDRVALVDRGADHYALLGIAQDASAELVRAAYFTLARKLHPDRLASLGIVDAQRDAQRLFAQINTAFAVLNDPAQRAEYNSILSRGGVNAVRAADNKADELAMRIMHAEEAFKRGEMALRREQLDVALQEFTTAVELQPTEPEYQALLVWTKFIAASDKSAIAAPTRQQLLRSADKLENSPTARFYLGRVERILGREREALQHFYEVLKIKPNHAEASSEIRILEQRLKGKR